MAPPPIPNSAEIAPTTPPAMDIATFLGAIVPGFGVSPMTILVANRSTKTPKSVPSTVPDKLSAINTPAIAPSIKPGSKAINQARCTLPLRKCPRAEEAPVMTIVASEVPTARCIVISGEMPCSPKANTSTGTIMIPPPTPNSPAIVPATAPSAK